MAERREAATNTHDVSHLLNRFARPLVQSIDSKPAAGGKTIAFVIMNAEIQIVSAEHSGDYRIHMEFGDGKAHEVDFRPFLVEARHPEIRAFLDPKRFAGFRVEFGELIWGDYELCFPVADLYDNHIMSGHSDKLAA